MRNLIFTFVLLSACGQQETKSQPVMKALEPSSLTLTYLGTAGWQLSSDSATLLVDPYVTRLRVKDEFGPLIPDEAAIAKYVPSRADVILVTHSHYDHVLDVPSIAKRTHAIVVGTESTSHLLLASGAAAEQAKTAVDGSTFTVGRFRVRAIASAHSLIGMENELIPQDVKLPLHAKGYGEGGTLQYLVNVEGRAVYFVGTANLVESAIKNVQADVAVVAVGLREKVPNYTCRLLRAIGQPRLVIANHFDAFRTPIEKGGTELDHDTQKDLEAFAQEVHACSPRTRVETPVHFRAIAL